MNMAAYTNHSWKSLSERVSSNYIEIVCWAMAKCLLTKLFSYTECYLSQIGKAVFYGNYNETDIGCWMRDPKPVKQEDEKKYWVTRTHLQYLLEEFDSKENFRNKLVTQNYTLDHRFSGNAQAICSGSFYYSEEGTNKLVIFNLDSKVSGFVDLQPNVRPFPYLPTPKSARHVRNHRLRRWRRDNTNERRKLYKNQLNQMDIAVDENGIWVMYPNMNSDVSNTIVTKINSTGGIEFMWNLTIDYNKVGDTFVVCGILYGLDSLTQFTTHISFAYDLYQNVELSDLEQIQFTNPFNSTQYVGYNWRHQKLYTWDQGNILEYPLKIETKLSTPHDSDDNNNDKRDD